MPRYALKIEYDGGPFVGWQRQKDHASVQQVVEEALRRLDPDVRSISAAGRTDAGVHALGQIAHCDMVRDWDPFRLSEALNYHLKPQPVAVVAVAAVDNSFHARFSAVERRYLFRLVSRRAPVVQDRGWVWQVGHALDLAAMQEAAAHLLGQHDFTTFRSSECQAESPVKTLDALDIEELVYPCRLRIPVSRSGAELSAQSGAQFRRHAGACRRRRLGACRRAQGAGGARSLRLRAGLSAAGSLSRGGPLQGRSFCLIRSSFHQWKQ